MTPKGFNSYIITFNGQLETWFVSERKFTHEEAMNKIKEAGKTAPHAYEMLEMDTSNGKTRACLLSETGAKGFAWTADLVLPDSCAAYIVYLTTGPMGIGNRNDGYVALCRNLNRKETKMITKTQAKSIITTSGLSQREFSCESKISRNVLYHLIKHDNISNRNLERIEEYAKNNLPMQSYDIMKHSVMQSYGISPVDDEPLNLEGFYKWFLIGVLSLITLILFLVGAK